MVFNSVSQKSIVFHICLQKYKQKQLTRTYIKRASVMLALDVLKKVADTDT